MIVRALSFFLEHFLSEIAPASTVIAFDSSEIAETFTSVNPPQCSASVDSSVYESITDDVIEGIIDRQSQEAAHSSCSSLNLGINVGNIAQEVDEIVNRKRKLTGLTEENEWDSTSHFEYVCSFR